MMADEQAPMTVLRHTQLMRYEARVGADLVTVIDFTLSSADVGGETLVITSTRTDPQWRGKGYAGQATAAMLDDIRAAGGTVRPVCPFTVDFMSAHPEYDDLRG